MKFRERDRVKIVSDEDDYLKKYIGRGAEILQIDPNRKFSYLLKIDGLNGEMWWNEEGIRLEEEFIEEQAEENLKKFFEINTKVTKAAEYAGITKEQAYKFMDGLR